MADNGPYFARSALRRLRWNHNAGAGDISQPTDVVGRRNQSIPKPMKVKRCPLWCQPNAHFIAATITVRDILG